MNLFKEKSIAVIGLGYVGLPLAMEFSKKYSTIGFDLNQARVSELKEGIDKTNEVDFKKFDEEFSLVFTADIDDIKSFNVFIVTVPTPIDEFKAPDLRPLKKAANMIGKVLKKNDLVIFESTVYPGCTEEVCVPLLEESSGLIFNVDFYCGYSPERINPGDKINTLTKIKKVTSGSNLEIAEVVDGLYRSIISAGTYKAQSMMVAEASKAIENAQRDLNISFVNELALIFDKMGLDTNDVLEAAGTKWNFLKFKPGLVGGHCISVDPYYLTHKAESLGYYPQVISSGRRVNDGMGIFIANKLLKLMAKRKISFKFAKILMLGITFKENCPDIRNSKAIDVYREIKEFGLQVEIYDPVTDAEVVMKEFELELINELGKYDAIILVVAHDIFLNIDLNLLKKGSESVVFDLKAFFPKKFTDLRL